MATKKKATKKTPALKSVSRPRSHMEELREQSLTLSNIGTKGWGQGTVQDCLEEIMKALTPLRYLKNASIDFSEELNEFVVSGYLQLFLRHMDALLAQGEIILMYPTPHDHAA